MEFMAWETYSQSSSLQNLCCEEPCAMETMGGKQVQGHAHGAGNLGFICLFMHHHLPGAICHDLPSREALSLHNYSRDLGTQAGAALSPERRLSGEASVRGLGL